MEHYQIAIIGLVLGYVLDLLLGDPSWLPHPVVLFGHIIGRCERTMNRGRKLLFKGAACGLLLIGAVFFAFAAMEFAVAHLPQWAQILFCAVFAFYGLANRTLITEVKSVFAALDVDLDKGRIALSRIVGRDTKDLNASKVRKAALETLSENLSDGVVAPLFYYAIGGIPAMMAYKMVNTLDSMWGYRNERYLYFGRFAARIDDVANYIPARLTALLMGLATVKWSAFSYACRFGRRHLSPNSGYPEAALAGILRCQFGGGSYYGGVYFDKPLIGDADRSLTGNDLKVAVYVNQMVTLLMVAAICVIYYLLR